MENKNPSSNFVSSYPLVPMQHGMLFNTLYQPEHGIDLTHIVYDLPEEIEFALLQTAWQQCVDQHDIFRTGFEWEGRERPFQHVYPAAKLPFVFVDWSAETAVAQEMKFKQFLRTDRQQGFDFAVPPLMRCTLIKLASQRFRFVWTFHHSIIDGRASSLVLYEAFSRYDALLSQTELSSEPPVPYQKYVDWLYTQSWEDAEQYWRERLAGFEQTTPIPADDSGEPDVQLGDPAFEQKLYLSAEITAKLQAITEQYDITFNTMVQGAWALLLHHYNNSDDVVFGSVRACRRSAFAGTENIIGQLINSVPMRTKLTPNTSVADWLEALRQQWNSIRPYEHAPYIKIKSWSEVPKGTPLFETTALYDHANVDSRHEVVGGQMGSIATSTFSSRRIARLVCMRMAASACCSLSTMTALFTATQRSNAFCSSWKSYLRPLLRMSPNPLTKFQSSPQPNDRPSCMNGIKQKQHLLMINVYMS